jgi:integrase
MYADGGGLYLQIGGGGRAKSWIFRYSRSRFGRDGEAHMGLGPAHTISLDEARELARVCRQRLLGGIDPLMERTAERRAKQLEASKDVTFEFCARDFLVHKQRGLSPDGLRNVSNAVLKHLVPTLGKLPIAAVGTNEIEQVLRPIWDRHMGEFVRLQLQAILARATAKGFRAGDNPASLQGPLGILLGEGGRLHVSRSHPAMPYQEIGAFTAKLRAYRIPVKGGAAIMRGKVSPSGKALEFIILTAIRASQATGMRWEEIDWAKKLWVCPWHRLGHKAGKKTKEDHIIPLSDAALAVLMEMQNLQQQLVESRFVFANQRNFGGGHRAGDSIDRHAPSLFLKKELKNRDITVHGFRTTFSSWANDRDYPREAIEMALGHLVGNRVERVYNRDAKRLEQRRKLMAEWAEYCGRTEPLPSEVIPLRKNG